MPRISSNETENSNVTLRINSNETDNSNETLRINLNETVNSNGTDHENRDFLSILGNFWAFLLMFRVLLIKMLPI